MFVLGELCDFLTIYTLVSFFTAVYVRKVIGRLYIAPDFNILVSYTLGIFMKRLFNLYEGQPYVYTKILEPLASAHYSLVRSKNTIFRYFCLFVSQLLSSLFVYQNDCEIMRENKFNSILLKALDFFDRARAVLQTALCLIN